ncbi:Transcription factor bHLH92, partial [Linum perenne]
HTEIDGTFVPSPALVVGVFLAATLQVAGVFLASSSSDSRFVFSSLIVFSSNSQRLPLLQVDGTPSPATVFVASSLLKLVVVPSLPSSSTASSPAAASHLPLLLGVFSSNSHRLPLLHVDGTPSPAAGIVFPLLLPVSSSTLQVEVKLKALLLPRKMDDFFVDELIQVVNGCAQAPSPSFSAYSSQDRPASSNAAPSANPSNLNKRMMQFQKTNWEANGRNKQSFRHMMSERLRREREKDGYSSLLSMLPPNTKNNKNSIVTGATRRIEELEGYKQLLETRIMELQEATHESSSDDHGGNRSRVVKKVEIKVANPASGLGSMLEVLYQLEALGAKPTTIHAKFSRQEFQAAMDVETQRLCNQEDAGEVEKAVQNSLHDTERELPSHTSSISGSFVLESWQQNEQV